MYSEFSTYVAARVTELNTDIAGTSSDLGLMTILDPEGLSENQKNLSYVLKLDALQDREEDATRFSVNGIIEMSFEVVADDTTGYQTILDTYVYGLIKKIKLNPDYMNATETIKFEIGTGSLKAEGLNNFLEEGTVLRPRIVFEARYIEELTLPALPAAPTLLTPANGATVTARDFTWSSVALADTYDFKLSNSGGIVLQQNDIELTAFSVPSGVMSAGAYTWTVRSSNESGNGDFAVPFSITFSLGSVPDAPTLSSPSGNIFDIKPVLVWNATENTTAYDVQIATDTGFTTIFESASDIEPSAYAMTLELTKNTSYYWRARAKNGAGNGSWSSYNTITFISRPVFWFEADYGVTVSGSDVTAWADKSGNNNDLTTGSTNKPVYSATGGANNLAQVSNALDSVYMTLNKEEGMGRINEYYMVMKVTGAGSNFLCGANNTSSLSFDSATNFYYNGEGSFSGEAVAGLGSFFLFHVWRNDTTTVNYQKDALAADSVVLSGNGYQWVKYVFARGTTPLTNAFKGSLCAFVSFDVALSAAERTYWNDYLDTKYFP